MEVYLYQKQIVKNSNESNSKNTIFTKMTHI